MTIQFSFDVDAYCRKGAKRRERLMKPGVMKSKPVTGHVINIANGIPAWKKGFGFDAHVDAYRKSSRFAQGPNVYIRRRAIEMGFAPEDVLDHVRFRPLSMLRALLVWEVDERFGLPIKAIADMMEMDHTAAYSARNGNRPDPAKVCVCSITQVGMTYFEALRAEYHSGADLTHVAARFGVSHTSIHRMAHRLGWTLRQSNKGGRPSL